MKSKTKILLLKITRIILFIFLIEPIFRAIILISLMSDPTISPAVLSGSLCGQGIIIFLLIYLNLYLRKKIKKLKE